MPLTQTERRAIDDLRQRVDLLARSTANGAAVISTILPVVGPGPAADALLDAQRHLVAASRALAPLRSAVVEVEPDGAADEPTAAWAVH